MNRDMMDEIILGTQLINDNEEVKVGIVTGNGRAFMAGADINEYSGQTQEQLKAFQDRGLESYARVEHASQKRGLDATLLL